MSLKNERPFHNGRSQWQYYSYFILLSQLELLEEGFAEREVYYYVIARRWG